MIDPYLFSLALGATGLVAMAFVGTHGHGHHGSHTGSGHGRGHAHDGFRWSVLLSPRIGFTLLVGFGAVGVALRHLLAGPVLVGVALAGGLLFELLLIKPIWNFLNRFASRPALTLDHGVMDEAEAVTSFNAAGDGLVKLMVDGQVLQLLGSITPADRVAGVRIKAGDKVIIEAVDGARQRCTVSRRDKA